MKLSGGPGNIRHNKRPDSCLSGLDSKWVYKESSPLERELRKNHTSGWSLPSSFAFLSSIVDKKLYYFGVKNARNDWMLIGYWRI
jgi:hypothetical protein